MFSIARCLSLLTGVAILNVGGYYRPYSSLVVFPFE